MTSLLKNNQPLEGCRDISIYLGNVCNFNCTYCDRDYIKDTMGGQHMSPSDIPSIIEFIQHVGADITPPSMFSFHGGEPFTYVKVMDKIMSAIVDTVQGDYTFFIQTNGSQLLQHRWFFEKWSTKLTISISYDFLFQDINRTTFDIEATLKMLRECNVSSIQFQYVMPIHNPKVFSLMAIKSITDVCFKNNVRRVNLIPLRHIRGKDKFKVIIDEISLPQFFDAFLKFIQILYVMGIDVIIDGHGQDIDKHYFNNHKQLILSPDGYIYPEYDFLEYRQIKTTVGTWKNGIEVVRAGHNEDSLLYDKCVSCKVKDDCGLKYLHKMFEVEPGDACVQFYEMLTISIKHMQKLKQKKNLLEWISI